MTAIHPGPLLDVPLAPSAPVTLAAHEVTRRFGDGDSAVDALRGGR
jgi:hypothetical protein